MSTSPEAPDRALPRVIVIGGGFAGLAAAKILARERVRLTVLDKRNHHVFQPLLYQVATAGLSPADIAMPIRAVLRNMPDTEVLMARVERVDTGGKLVHLDRGESLPYDYLLIATGARHSYFGKPEWEKVAPGLKNLEEATEIRKRILTAFEEAERATDPARREACLTFVIVGGGPTGIEMAGAIAELARNALAADFNRINPTLARVILVEAGDRLLSAMAPVLSARAKRSLEKLGVTVRLGGRVTDVTPEGVAIGAEFIPARTTIWAAGVEPSPLAKTLGVPLDKSGRVIVEVDLSIPGHPEVFVAGDLAHVVYKGGTVPGMAPGAMQEGRAAARNILLKLGGRPARPFKYVDKGSLATIGRASAVAEVGPIKISGVIAWYMWLVVHIMYLIGFRNRLLVLIQWTWSYVTFQRGTRLITDASAPK